MSLEFNLISSDKYCTYITDGTHGTHINQESGKYLLSAKDILDGVVHIKENSRVISEEDFNKIHKNYKLENYDVLLTVAGTIGRTAIIRNYKNNYTFQRSVAIFKTNDKLKSLWLYYYLNSPIGKQIVKSLSKGTTQLILPLKDLRNLEIPVPKNIEDQKKILSILVNIDKKIEVNKKINKNLEKTLITIFNSWFINFENYDNSKGMKIDDSYGEIPVDWSVEMLEDYVDFVTGVEPGSKNYHEKPEPNDIPFLRVGDLGSRDNGVFIDPSLSKNKILKYDDIVLSLDATIGIVKMGLEGAYSTGMRKLVIKNDNINQPFLYCLVKSNRIQRIIETFATGTTMLHAGKSIKHMNFVLSDKKTMDDFGKIGNPIISIILTNLKEIEYLTNLRDTLLPKLMSGKIDVSKINCDLKIIIRKIYIKSSKLFLWRYLSENKNYIKNTKSNETLLKSRTIYKINKFLAKFNARYRYYRQ